MKTTAEQTAAILDAFSDNPILAQLTPDEAGQVRAISTLNEYKPNDLVFSEEQPAHYLFLVAKGTLELSLKNKDVKRFSTGDIFGEIGILNNSIRSGSVRSKTNSSVVAICGTRMFNPDHIEPSLALRITRALAKKITDYLISREQFSTHDLIEKGEGEFVEFKSTLRMNLKSGKKDRNMELTVLKTIAGFLNSKGGTLLIGVADNGDVVGIEKDNFANEDKFLLHLTNLIKSRIGSLHLDYLNFEVTEFDQGRVVRVDCDPANQPAYLIDGDNEYLFIRTGPATTNLRLSKVHEFISKRFTSLLN